MRRSPTCSGSPLALRAWCWAEGQILGQVKEAYQAAIKNRTVNSILHHVFQNAARVGKKVREETGLDQGKLSIASVAVDVAKGFSTPSPTRRCWSSARARWATSPSST